MVRIPDRPYARLADGRLDAPRGANARLFQAFEHAGGAVMRTALALREKREHDALVEAQNAYVESCAGGGAGQGERAAHAPGEKPPGDSSRDTPRESVPGPLADLRHGFQDRHRAAVEENLARMRESGISESARQAFANWAKEREKAGLAEAAEAEYRAMLQRGEQSHRARVQGIFAQVANAPASWADACAQLEESHALAVGQGIYRAKEARERFLEVREKLKQAAFTGMYARHPEQAMQSMDSLELDDEWKKAATARYQADIAEREARGNAVASLQRHCLGMQIEAVDHHASQSGEVSGLRELAEGFAAVGEDKEAKHLAGRALFYESHAAVIRQSRAMPLPELAETIRRLEKDHGGATGDDGNPEGKEEEQRLRYAIYEERLHALESDPVAAVTPEVEAALAGSGTDLAGLTNLRLAAQASSGVPANRRRVLSNAESVRRMEAWQAGDVEARKRMAQDFQQYGPYAGKVAQEAGVSPSEQLWIAQAGRDSAAGRHLSSVIEANFLKNSALPVVEHLETLVGLALEQSEIVRGTRAAAGSLPGDARLRATLKNYTSTLSKLIRMNDGDSDAAVAAFDGRLRSLTGDAFALVYDPKAYVYPDDLEEGLKNVKNGPALEQVADSLGYAGKQRSRWLAAARDTGIWLNAPCWDGYALYEPESRMPIADGQGNLFCVRDADLRGVMARERLWRMRQEWRSGSHSA